MILLFDRCLGKRLPEALRQLKPPAEIIAHHEHFPPEEPDDKWLKVAGENRWTVITQDDKWHRIAAERAAVNQHEVGCFCLGGASATTWNTARLFLRSFDEIERIVGETPHPFLYLVEKSGRITRKNIAEQLPETEASTASA